MVAALAAGIALGIMNGFHISWGTGCAPVSKELHTYLTVHRQHSADLDLSVILVPTLKHWYAYQMVYPWALFFVKASILALYHRIFIQAKFRYTLYAVTALVTIHTIVVFFMNASFPTIFDPRTYKTDHTRPSNAEVDPHKRGHPRSQRVAITCR